MCILQTQSTGGSQGPLCMSAQISCQENSACGSIISESFDHASPRQVPGVPQKTTEHKKNFSSGPFLLIKITLDSARQSEAASTMHHLPSYVPHNNFQNPFPFPDSAKHHYHCKGEIKQDPLSQNITFKNFSVKHGFLTTLIWRFDYHYSNSCALKDVYSHRHKNQILGSR